MKKFLFLAPLLTLMLLLSGCGKTDGTTDEITEPEDSSVEDVQDTEKDSDETDSKDSDEDIDDEDIDDEDSTDDEDSDDSVSDDDSDSDDDSNVTIKPNFDLNLPDMKVELNDGDDDDTPPIVIPDLERKVILPVKDSIGPFPPVEEIEVPQL